jgi:hypothetical protein
LLEIRAVVLVEASAKENRPQELLPLVLSEKADRGRVVMNLAQLNLENSDRLADHLGDQAAAVCLVQEVQRLAESFVGEAIDVPFVQTEELRYVATNPIRYSVQSELIDDQVPQKDQERLRRWDL